MSKKSRDAHEKGQPVLVGTTSIERSEFLSELLTKEDITHKVLNARHHEQEAQIVADAGKPGAVTIATNMAGRGTDIQLGGNVEMRVLEALAEDPEADPEAIRSRIEAEVVEAQGEGAGRRRSFRFGHRAARKPPDRQPASRSFRSSGRSGSFCVLS